MNNKDTQYREFNLGHAKAGAPVQTKKGEPVEVVAFDRSAKFPLFGDIQRNGHLVRSTWDGSGMARHGSANESLGMAPLGYLDGAPVFVGDIVFNTMGHKLRASPEHRKFDNCSWDDPTKRQCSDEDMALAYLCNKLGIHPEHGQEWVNVLPKLKNRFAFDVDATNWTWWEIADTLSEVNPDWQTCETTVAKSAVTTIKKLGELQKLNAALTTTKAELITDNAKLADKIAGKENKIDYLKRENSDLREVLGLNEEEMISQFNHLKSIIGANTAKDWSDLITVAKIRMMRLNTLESGNQARARQKVSATNITKYLPELPPMKFSGYIYDAKDQTHYPSWEHY